jgi:hypothetical protein
MNQHSLTVGGMQTFIFHAGDKGPFWMTEEERELNRHDQTLPPTPGNPTRNKTIKELKIKLTELNVVLSEHQNYCLAELQEIARNNNILDTKIKKQEGRKVGRASQKVFCKFFGKGDGLMKGSWRNTQWSWQWTTMVKCWRVLRIGV